MRSWGLGLIRAEVRVLSVNAPDRPRFLAVGEIRSTGFESRLSSQLGVVPHEFLVGTQPIFDVVAVLPAT